MRNIFKTGSFGNRGTRAIVRGMARSGVKNYRKESLKNKVEPTQKVKRVDDVLDDSKLIAYTGIGISLLSFPTCSMSVEAGFLQFLSGIFVFFLAAVHEFIKHK